MDKEQIRGFSREKPFKRLISPNFLNHLWAATALLLCAACPLSAQEQLGMRLERYAGLFAGSINPANVAFMPHNWEISLFSAEVFAENSYAYFHKTSLQNLLKNTDAVVAASDLSPDRPIPANAIVQDYFVPKRKMRGLLHSRVSGPGTAFRVGRHVFGISTAVRADLSAYRVPRVLNYPEVSQLSRGQTIAINPFGVETMSWAEIGLHYGQSVTDRDIAYAWGVTPKLLIGMAGGFGRSERAFEFTPGGGDTAVVGRPTWRYGVSGNLLEADQDGASPKRSGSGFAVDLGVSFYAPDDEDGYFWRAGAALLDLGAVRFADGAEQHRIVYDSIQSIDGSNIKADNLRDYTRSLSAVVLGDPQASLVSQRFSMGLPTALSLQAEARVFPHVYLGGVLVQRIPLSKHALKRASTLAFTPRYEYRWLSVSAPILLNDWQSPRFGLAARLAWLYIGSDNMGSFFTKEKLSGADAYIGLKINGFRIRMKEREGSGLRRDKGRSSKQNRKKIKCYNF
jgi:hypothetical protein